MALLGRFGPPLALMALIFLLSAQPDLGTGFGLLDHVARKLAHAVEFGVLFLLWWRALGRDHALAAAVIAVLYAVSDEYHQTFVEGRHGSPLDVFVDASGVAVAWALVTARRQREASTA